VSKTTKKLQNAVQSFVVLKSNNFLTITMMRQLVEKSYAGGLIIANKKYINSNQSLKK
jgi:hypothetical protein